MVGFHVKSRICEECKSEKKQLMQIRRLNCGHKVCVDCLTKRFLVNDFKCSQDQLDIFGCFKNKSTVANNTQSSKIVSK